MDRLRLMFTLVVKDDERALLMRDGRFERLLGPGRHAFLDPLRRLTAETVKVSRAEFPAERARLIARTHPAVAAEHFTVARPEAGEVLIVSLDGEPKFLVAPYTERVFWKTLTDVAIERIDTRAMPRVEKRHLDKINVAGTALVAEARVEAHEGALLFVDGVLIDELAPGRHAFWQIDRKVEIRKFDLRPQPLEVAAQEILTKDRIGLRLTLTAFWRITDMRKAVTASGDLATALYRLVQFAAREAVATRTLDEILSARDEIDAEIRGFVGVRMEALGIATTELGVKDVILPGDIRALINKVVEAERVARANLVRRQEETAATRSLLNTAKLMEANPLLLRMKELEALEKLVEKVGRIDLHAGDGPGLDALLTKLWRIGGQAEAAT